MSIQKKLKKERVRLGFSQPELARICNVSKQAVSAWENESQISLDRLGSLVPYGFDVQYILTGIRSTNLNQVQDSYEFLLNSNPAELIDRITALTDKQRLKIELEIEEMETLNRLLENKG